jgi:chemotaxis protein MotB
MPFSQVQVVENSDRSGDMAHFVQPMKGILSPNCSSTPLKDVQAELEKALAPEIKKRVVEVKSRKEGLVISLQEVGFYESGSAGLRASSKDSMDRLAAILKERTESLRIEGHTDNVPIHGTRYASNWELSTARASDLIKLFITRYNFAPIRLSAAGFAEFHPVASNVTPEGRVRNRRVDIVVLNPPTFEAVPSKEDKTTITPTNGRQP